MQCFICSDSRYDAALVPLGCACRSGSGYARHAHVECMARLARARGAWRECRTCERKLTGRMLHMLCGHPTGTGSAVCRIHDLVGAMELDGIACVARPVNDQTCLRVKLPSGPSARGLTGGPSAGSDAAGNDAALSVAARGQGYEAALVDHMGRVVSESGSFGADEIPRLLRHIRTQLLMGAHGVNGAL